MYETTESEHQMGLLEVRKVVERLEIITRENDQPLAKPLRIAIVAVVFKNPYPVGYVADVVTLADKVAGEVGDILGARTIELLGDKAESYGKAALVGTEGEVEHGSAIIHNLLFGNKFRDAAGGKELLPAAEKVGAYGTSIDIPIKHMLDAKTRSHHQTITFRVEDAPLPREIMIACVAANGGRPLARLAAFGSEVK